MDQIINVLNNDKIFAGCMMIFMNIGSRYIAKDIPKSLDKIFQNIWLRRFIVFCIAFISTHDIITSIFITLIFIITFSYLLNEESNMCVLPPTLLEKDDGQSKHSKKITTEEATKAKKILDKFNEQNKNLGSAKTMNK